MKATVHHVRILRSDRVALAQFTLTLRQGRRIVACGYVTLQGDAELSEESIQIVESLHDLSAELHKLQDAEADEGAGQAIVNAVLDACFARLALALKRAA